MRPGYVIDLVRHVAEAAPERADSVADEFRGRYGDSPALQQILPRLRARARRTLQLLDA